MEMTQLTESDLQDRLISYFSKWFDVDYEVTSLCRSKRIDLILTHHSDTDKLYQIGIEIKKLNIKSGGEIANWCLQASQYKNLLFKEKKTIIFVAPQISGFYLNEGDNVSKHDVALAGMYGYHNNINSFLYKCFGFGELQKFCNAYMRLVINTKLIWSSQDPHTFHFQNLLLCK